jgi:hypothetical protein
LHYLTCCTINQNPLRVEDRPFTQHYQPVASLRNGHGEARDGMGALRRLESQNDHLTSKHRVVADMGLLFTLIRRLSMLAWVRCQAFFNVQRTRRRIRMDGVQGSSALNACRRIRPHLPGTAQERELRNRNRRSFLDPHRGTLQVYLPFFVTDDFITSKRLEAALQHRTLQVMAGLPPAMLARVHERFLDAPRSFGENGEEAGAIYCVFVTVMHVDP